MEEREDQEMRRRKGETDQLFLLYQQEKDKKRKEDSQTLSELHLKQAVNPSFIPFILLLFLPARTKGSRTCDQSS